MPCRAPSCVSRTQLIGGLGLIAKSKFCALKKFDTMLKEVDEEYRTTLINFAKYKLVMFTMAKIMEMEQQSKIK